MLGLISKHLANRPASHIEDLKHARQVLIRNRKNRARPFLYYPHDLTHKGTCENSLVVCVVASIFRAEILIKKRGRSVHSSSESGIRRSHWRIKDLVNALFRIRKVSSIVVYYVTIRSYRENIDLYLFVHRECRITPYRPTHVLCGHRRDIPEHQVLDLCRKRGELSTQTVSQHFGYISQ